MATSSFSKDFTFNTKKAVESFEKIISTNANRISINKALLPKENEIRGEKKIRQMLSQYKNMEG